MQAKMEGLEDRVHELCGDLALLRIQLARAEAEKETLAQRLQRLQVQQYTSVAVDTPVRAHIRHRTDGGDCCGADI